MAKAAIIYQWPDGQRLAARIEVDPSYPDAIAEAKAQALTMFREAWAATVAEDE